MRAALAIAAAAALAGLAASPAAAQRTADPRDFSEGLMRTFVERGGEALIDQVLATTALGEDRTARQSIQDQRARWIRQVVGLGTPMAWEYVGERRYGASVQTQCWVAKYRRHPLFFSFRFYRFEDAWDLVNYAWTTQDNLRNWECAALGAAPAGVTRP